MLRSLATFIALAALVVLGGALYQRWSRVGPEPLDPYRREAARLVAEQIAQQIRTDNDLEGPVLLLPLAGDKGEHEVSRLIQQAIDDAGRYRLVAPEALLEYLDDAKLTPESLRTNPAAIADAVGALGAVGLLTGRIARFPAPRGHEKTELDLILVLHDLRGAPLFEQRFHTQVVPDPASLAYWRASIASMGGWTRLLLWLALVLFLPIALLPISRRVLRRESNRANLLLLLFQIAIGTSGAFVALELRVEGAWDALALMAAFAISSAWSFLATSAVERFR